MVLQNPLLEYFIENVLITYLALRSEMMLVCLGLLKKPNKSFLMVAYKPKAVMGYVNLPLDSSPFELKSSRGEGRIAVAKHRRCVM